MLPNESNTTVTQRCTKGIATLYKLIGVLVLLFSLSIGNAWGAIAAGTYELCTSTSDLEANAHYIIASGTSGTVQCISNVSQTNYREIVAASVSNSKITVAANSTIMTFTLGGSADAWTFYTDNYAGTAGYLASAASGNNNYCRVLASSTTGTISISSNVATIALNPHSTRKYLMYNSGSSRFACYSSGQADVYLYKLSASCDKKVTIVKGTPETGGSFNLDKTGAQDCCSALTVTVSNITAPSGKEFDAITQSGIATGVTINQSSKTVTYAANSTGTSTINVTFRDLPKYTVTLMDDGATHTQASYGASVTLPSRSGCSGYTFAGWTKTWVAEQTSWTTTAPTVIPAGSYTPTANENLYPVYTKTEGGGTATATITASNFTNLGSNNYGSGAERTGTVGTISLGGHYITGNSTNIQCQANNANIYNKTAFPGKITRVVLNQTGTVAFSLYVGTEQLMASDNTSTGQTPSGTKITDVTSANTMTWDVTGNYTYFDIKKGGSAGYISSIVVTYSSSTTSYISVPNCCSAPATALSISGSDNVTTGNTSTYSIGGGNGGTVTWSVTNGTGSATINSSGVLTAGSVGTVTVKAHQDATGGYCAQDAEKTVTIVSSTVNVTGVSVTPTSKAIVVGETFTITPTISPSNATDKTVSWSSSASGKASVSSSGVVTGEAAGSATITCTTNDGGYTATCDVTVYSATITSVVDEDGADISGTGVSASISARDLTANEGSTLYKFKTWEFVGNKNGLDFNDAEALSASLTGTPSGNVSLKAVFYKPVTIAWKVGTDDAAAGSQTLNAKRGTEWKDLTLPSAPADNTLSACSNKFMGWTNGDELEGTGNSAPAVCLKSFSGVTTAIESPLTFRAVFATESAGGEAVNTVLFSEDFSGYSADDVPSGSVDNDHTGTTVYNGGSVTYSCTNGTKTSGSTAGGTTAVKNEYLAEGTAPEIMVGKKGSGDGAVGGTFVISGIPNGGASELTVSYKQNANGLSATASGTSYSGSKTASTKAEQSFDVTVGSGTMTLTFQATTTSNVRLDNIEVKVKTRGVTYSNYVTKCCTQHTITLAGSGSVTGGTFTSDPTSACEDVEVHLSATPDESHEFGSWTITNTSTGDDVTDDVTLVDNDFLMPDYGVTVTPTFNALTAYTVTWMVDGTTWSGKGGSTVVYQGRRISTLPTAPDYEDFCGDVFIGWTTVANYVHGSSPLYTKASDFPTASADQIFYAVFADFNE